MARLTVALLAAALLCCAYAQTDTAPAAGEEAKETSTTDAEKKMEGEHMGQMGDHHEEEYKDKYAEFVHMALMMKKDQLMVKPGTAIVRMLTPGGKRQVGKDSRVYKRTGTTSLVISSPASASPMSNGRTIAMVDTGLPVQKPALCKALKLNNLVPQMVSHVILTQDRLDYSGNTNMFPHATITSGAEVGVEGNMVSQDYAPTSKDAINPMTGEKFAEDRTIEIDDNIEVIATPSNYNDLTSTVIVKNVDPIMSVFPWSKAEKDAGKRDESARLTVALIGSLGDGIKDFGEESKSVASLKKVVCGDIKVDYIIPGDGFGHYVDDQKKACICENKDCGMKAEEKATPPSTA